ncbi:hypothetical protein POVWA2_073690 [Plasmodium ovale wallikeri]|uniref:Uncharacterized protein n=1 Tax=Plasmodium ovale wallikeri TaxID=864142 RepID=A0A1A9AJV3_PLAOA|nr:hypothetical protein POVWA1_069520 [Plasmodium ovale wallikeri]SBT56468.1 hypothetical protein POVWA2_073690 [Plasmodium ovale wallikeri]
MKNLVLCNILYENDKNLELMHMVLGYEILQRELIEQNKNPKFSILEQNLIIHIDKVTNAKENIFFVNM